MEGDARDPGEQAAVSLLHVAVVGDVVVEDGHPPAPDSGADIRHSAAVSDVPVLVVGYGLTRAWGGVEETRFLASASGHTRASSDVVIILFPLKLSTP